MNLSSIRRIGVINTIRMNLHYFGFLGVLHPRIFASKYVSLRKLDGEIHTDLSEIGSIRIGMDCPGVIDGKSNRCVWENAGTIVFKGKAYLGAGTKIVNYGNVILGNNITFTGNVALICYRRISIGNDCLVSWDCQISDSDFHKILSVGGIRENEDQEVVIHNNVWIGSRCLIIKGSSIPSDSVIAAGSIVTKKLSTESAVYVGNNAVKKDISWLK